MTIKLDITHSAKTYKGERYSNWEGETKYFKTLKEALKWLRSEYKGRKRSIMYRDTKKGESFRVGYIYSFRNSDYEDGKKINFIQEDWVELTDIHTKPIKKWR